MFEKTEQKQQNTTSKNKTKSKFKNVVPNQMEQGLVNQWNPHIIQKKSATSNSDESTSNITNNNTGLPKHLKTGVESLSGMSMNDVKVHYNSPKPNQINAHAFTQGTDIHVASGQEKHLPHEAWHVVQQKQGRVTPTIQTKGIAVNDDSELEKEADIMGEKAVRQSHEDPAQKNYQSHSSWKSNPVQRQVIQKQAVDIMEDTKDMAWDIIKTMAHPYIKEIGVNTVGSLINSVTVYLVKAGLQLLASRALGKDPTAAMTTALNGLQAFSALYDVYKKLPPIGQVFIKYSIGSLMAKALPHYYVNKALVSKSGSIMGNNNSNIVTNTLISGLGMSGTKLGSVQLPVVETKDTFGGMLVGWVVDWYFQEAPKKDNKDEVNKSQQQQLDDGSPSDNGSQKPLLNIESKFFWLDVDNPTIGRWDKQTGTTVEEDITDETGGAMLKANLGVNLLGKTLSSKGNDLRLGWDGTPSFAVQEIALEGKEGKLVDLGIFKLNAIRATNININQGGLQSIKIAMQGAEIGDDILSIEEASVDWKKGQETVFNITNATVNALNSKPKTNVTLKLDEKGNFKEGHLSVEVDKMGGENVSLSGGKLEGDITKDEGFIDWKINGEVKQADFKLLGKQLTAKDLKLFLAKNGAFAVDADEINLGGQGNQGLIDLGFFGVESIKASNINLTNKGLNSIKLAVLGAQAGGDVVKIGNAFIDWSKDKDTTLGVEDASINIADKSVKAGLKVVLSKDGQLKQANVHCEMDEMNLIGDFLKLDKTTFDGSIDEAHNLKLDAKTGISVKFNFPGFDLDLDVPTPVPGLEVTGGLGISGSVGAKIDGNVFYNKNKGRPVVWGLKLGGELDAMISLKASLGVSLGSAYLIAVTGAVTLNADARGLLKGEMEKGFEYNAESKTFKGFDFTYTALFEPKVSTNFELQARALKVFKRTLYKYKFAEWKLGQYQKSGKITVGGNNKVSATADSNTGFKKGKGNQPDGLPEPKKEIINEKEEKRKKKQSKKQNAIVENYKHTIEEIQVKIQELSELKSQISTEESDDYSLVESNQKQIQRLGNQIDKLRIKLQTMNRLAVLESKKLNSNDQQKLEEEVSELFQEQIEWESKFGGEQFV